MLQTHFILHINIMLDFWTYTSWKLIIFHNNSVKGNLHIRGILTMHIYRIQEHLSVMYAYIKIHNIEIGF